MTTKSYLQTYTLLYSLPFLFIHYETERFLRATYLQNVLLLEEIFKQQKKEKRHAVEKINYENALEKMIEKQQFSQEINHLRILIGEWTTCAVIFISSLQTLV